MSNKDYIPVNSSIRGLNIKATAFYLAGHKEKVAKMRLVQLEENKYYDMIEKIWWEKNKKMFEVNFKWRSKCIGPKGPCKITVQINKLIFTAGREVDIFTIDL